MLDKWGSSVVGVQTFCWYFLKIMMYDVRADKEGGVNCLKFCADVFYGQSLSTVQRITALV